MKSRRASAKLLPLHLTQLPTRYSKALAGLGLALAGLALQH